jgi:pimeloyl-ACP methyl ester carboxylesterase
MRNLKLVFFCVALTFYNGRGYAQTEAPPNLQPDVRSGYFRSFDSTRIYYEVKGTGFPVILVHGFMNTGENWKRSEVYKDLQTAGYQVITLDMRGNGKSDKPHSAAAYANDAEAKDIIGIAGMLHLPKYNIVGYSRGSIITARVLVLDTRANKAVIGGMGTDFMNPEWPRRIMFYKALSGEPVPELEGAMKYVREAKLDQLALAYMQKEQPSTPKEKLASIKQPVLVIVGDADEDKEKAKDLSRIFKRGEYAVVPGDHGSASRTAEFSAAVLKFLK